MSTKLKKEGFKCLSFLISCFPIDEKIHPLVSVNIQKLLQLEGEICSTKIDCNKDHLSFELQLSQEPHEKEYPTKPNQLE
jgi:hypothetical protein